MKKKLHILIFIYLSICNVAYSQHKVFCGTDQYEELLSQDQQYQAKRASEEKTYRSTISNSTLQKRNDNTCLPVVFHLIHNNGPENISDTQIQQGLDFLNNAFANTGTYQNAKGIDTKISFCLAQRDEEGNDFSGILRHESPFTDMSIFTGFDYVQSKKLDPSKYINIQIVQNTCLSRNCDVAGFAGDNRIVLQANTFNNSSVDATVLIHEMGHYFGLYHTWREGCKNDNCLTDGDKVCDTPPDNRTFDLCSDPSNSCSSDENDLSDNNPFRPIANGGIGDQEDDHTNFMDYNVRFCREHFTQGQADRMQFFINHRYPSLLESMVCLPPCLDEVISFFDLPDSIEVGSELTLSNQSINADSYQWIIDGDSTSTSSTLNHTFTNIGTIEVQLDAYSIDTLCEYNSTSQNIVVFCPVKACFDYYINDQFLIIEDCSENLTSLIVTVINGTDTILISNKTLDSVYINNVDFVRVCFEARGEHCSDFLCEFITITSDGSEVCKNEEDDDGDGLIDLFDPDCPCIDEFYQAHCPQDCEITPDSFPDIKMKMKWESINTKEGFVVGSSYNVGDFDNDGSAEIVFRYSYGGFRNTKNYISVFGAENGILEDTFRIFPDYNLFQLPIYPALTKDRFSQENLLYLYSPQAEISCFDTGGVEIFRTGNIKSPIIGLADIDNNGSQEAFSGNLLFNGQNGSLLFSGDNSNCTNNDCGQVISVAADIIGNDGKPELITGKYVYQLEINNLDDSIGNKANIIEAPVGIEDGKCAVADIDGDGQLEIIVVQSNNINNGVTGKLSVWSPRSGQLLAQISNPITGDNAFHGSIPFVGDIDGDCIPEIGVVYSKLLRMYKFNTSGNLEILYSINTTDESGTTGVTMFDFNQDGKQELIYRDETSLRIIEGATGRIIDSTQLFSRTWLEYPVIADVDNDGDAEIIISGSLTSEEEVRLYCFESATSGWAPARSVWSQYAYNPTQVNDDLTIPRYQQNAAQPLQGTENCPRETCNTPYNNFMSQATFRTQEGCYVWPELQRDLSITASSRCIGDSLELCFYASSSDTSIIRDGVTLSYYTPPLGNISGQLIDSLTLFADTTCIMVPMLNNTDSIVIVINDEGGLYPPTFPSTSITECNYSNNIFTLPVGGPDFSIGVIDYECSNDSLIFFIATDNIGLDTDVSCIGGGCFSRDPLLDINIGIDPLVLETTLWCFNYDTTTLTYQYQDTFRVAIPIPIGTSEMWWSINEGGFGPGFSSSLLTGIYECDYSNNLDHISFDVLNKVLDLGPDITKCFTEIITLNAGSDFVSYKWNDFTTDSIYSTIDEGIHFVEAIDQCGRIYRDSIHVIIDTSDDLDLGPDISLCYDQDTSLTLSGTFSQVLWSPSEFVNCDTCLTVSLTVDTISELIVQAYNENCISYDTIKIQRSFPIIDTLLNATCQVDTIDFFGQLLTEDGFYEHLSTDCSRLDVLDLNFWHPDSTSIQEQICASDSILFDGQYLRASGVYGFSTQNRLGCDSIITLELSVVNELQVTDSIQICANDSINLFSSWISVDTLLERVYNSSAGCDSIQRFNVTITPLPQASIEKTFCEGDSIELYNRWFTSSGEFEITTSSLDNCDSLITVKLIMLDKWSTYDTINACLGDTIEVFSLFITNSQDISNDYSAINGCDSVSFYHVNFIDPIETASSILLCQGDSTYFNGEWIYNPGLYTSELISAKGCDSIHQLSVDYLDDPLEPTTAINCEDFEVVLSIAAVSNWFPFWDNGDSTFTTSYPYGTEQANLTFYSHSNCEKQLTINLPLIASPNDIPSFLDTLIEKNQTVSIDLGLNTDEWAVEWVPQSIVNCSTCMNVDITAIEDTEVTLYLTHNSGCTYESSFLINLDTEVTNNFFIPNVFSPNGDNSNDTWSLYLDSDVDVLSCMIYDRWGNSVYQANSADISWDGRSNAQDCIQGVYVYHINYLDADGKSMSISGDITLVR